MSDHTSDLLQNFDLNSYLGNYSTNNPISCNNNEKFKSNSIYNPKTEYSATSPEPEYSATSPETEYSATSPETEHAEMYNDDYCKSNLTGILKNRFTADNTRSNNNVKFYETNMGKNSPDVFDALYDVMRGGRAKKSPKHESPKHESPSEEDFSSIDTEDILNLQHRLFSESSPDQMETDDDVDDDNDIDNDVDDDIDDDINDDVDDNINNDIADDDDDGFFNTETNTDTDYETDRISHVMSRMNYKKNNYRKNSSSEEATILKTNGVNNKYV